MYLWEVSVQSDPKHLSLEVNLLLLPSLAPQPARTCFFSPSDKTALHNHFVTAGISYSSSSSTELDVIKHKEGKKWLLNNQNLLGREILTHHWTPNIYDSPEPHAQMVNEESEIGKLC